MVIYVYIVGTAYTNTLNILATVEDKLQRTSLYKAV